MLNRSAANKLILAAGLFSLFLGCGKNNGDETHVKPSPTPTSGPTNSDYNLSRYAKISSRSSSNPDSSEFSDHYAATNVRDGFVGGGTDGTLPDGYIWIPASGTTTSSRIRLEWNSQVVVSSISIYDNPQSGNQVLGGSVYFENSVDTHASLPLATFGELPDDAKSAAFVSAPGGPITALEVAIVKSKGSSPGISEIVVKGHRVEEAIAEGNVARSGAFPKGEQVAVKDPYSGPATGPYRLEKLIDGDLSNNSMWISNGLGINARLSMEFDRVYDVKKITLYDRTDMAGFNRTTTRFTSGQITSSSLTQPKTFSKDTTAPSVDVVFDPPVSMDKFQVEFSNVVYGSDTGLREIEVTGEYKP